MMLTPAEWHNRFSQQARWTSDLRNYLLGQIEIEKAQSVLEVGCGTGAILGRLPEAISLQAGLDIDGLHLELAMRNSPTARFSQGDAHSLPFTKACFDLSICHFLLLWVADPLQVVREMARVTRSGGAVLALAEPDYGGRIDFPSALTELGDRQRVSLKEQGADPILGRKLSGFFHRAGLQSVQTGILGGQWSGPPDWDDWESEWAVLASDLKITSEISENSDALRLKALDRSAYERGERVLFVPTFYAWGRVPCSSE